MFNKLKALIINVNKSLLPKELLRSRRKTILFCFSLYCIVISTFLTVVSQLPAFTSKGITQIFQIGWIVSFIPLLMLDYKQILRYLFFSLILVFPFIIYCFLALLFKVNAFTYGGTIYIFLCLFLFIIFGSFSKYKSLLTTKLICLSFLVSALFYAGIVFFAKLRGSDLSNPIYAFDDKNSAGPIFITAMVIAFYLFQKKNIIHFLLRWVIFIFFTTIIALSKTRSVLIAIPPIFFILLFQNHRKPIYIFVSIVGLFTLVAVFLAIPVLREKIIIQILFNNKTDLDSIFSGRISKLVENMQMFKPFLGTGGTYFDCMVPSLLCSYGIIGMIAVLPILVLPFSVLFRYKKMCCDIATKTLLACIIIIFLTGSLLEGYGYLGPGAKVFIFWFFVGNYSTDILKRKKERRLPFYYRKLEASAISISKQLVLFSIQIILIFISSASILSPSLSSNIGQIIVDKLPSSNPIASYTEVKDILIDPPVSSMCVGQKITFNVISKPNDAEDKTVYWSTGWITDPIIRVDGFTGEVTANRAGGALLHIDRFRVGPNGVYIQFPVSNVNNYTFDKAYISTHKFTKSFEYTSNEQIELNNYCTAKVFYDDYYIPDPSKVEFVSTNSSIAYVEEGLIRAISPGECEITAIIHGKEDTLSKNTISVKVNNSSFSPTTSIDLDVNHNWHRYQQYTIHPYFNKDACDKNFTIKVSGINHKIEDNQITFLDAGNALVEVISDNDNTIRNSYKITVSENQPTHFECAAKRMIIGEVKDTEQLGIYLVFENGYKKVVTEDDLLFNPFDFTNRAWSGRNGMIKNRTTFKAVVSGNIRFTYVSKINNEVKKTFDIISSVYTQKQYDYLTNGTGQLVLTFILLIAIIFSIFVSIKKEWLLFVMLYLASVLFIIMEVLLFGVTVFFAVSISIIASVLIIITLLRILKKRWFPVLFLEEPIEIEYRDENGLTDKDFYQFDI